MYRNRIIPCLTIKDKGLVKTVKFKDPNYIGDPINAVKIFNNKGADELMIVDIEASKNGEKINFDLLGKIANQSFMPLGYGGGIKSFSDGAKLFKIGYEKVCLDSIVHSKPELITELAKTYGNQSIVVCIDVKKNMLGKYKVYDHVAKKTLEDPVALAKKAERLGAGEIIVNNVDKDGMMSGYDTKLITLISEAVSIPVVALGGAGKIEDIDAAVKAGASAAAAGSLFVYYGPHKAVLINYPGETQ